MKVVAMVVSIMPRQCLANHRDQLRVCGKIDCRGKDEKKGRMGGGSVEVENLCCLLKPIPVLGRYGQQLLGRNLFSILWCL